MKFTCTINLDNAAFEDLSELTRSCIATIPEPLGLGYISTGTGGYSVKNNWYVGKTGNHQGLVIEEGTGRNVAVAYDKADAQLLAAGPELLEAAKMMLQLIEGENLDEKFDGESEVLRAAIFKAEERS